jgi:hypothetical protein
MRCYMTARAVTWQLLTRAPVDLALALFRTCLSSFRLPPLRGSPESFCLRSLRACALGVDEAKADTRRVVCLTPLQALDKTSPTSPTPEKLLRATLERLVRPFLAKRLAAFHLLCVHALSSFQRTEPSRRHLSAPATRQCPKLHLVALSDSLKSTDLVSFRGTF